MEFWPIKSNETKPMSPMSPVPIKLLYSRCLVSFAAGCNFGAQNSLVPFKLFFPYRFEEMRKSIVVSNLPNSRGNEVNIFKIIYHCMISLCGAFLHCEWSSYTFCRVFKH